MKSIQKKEKELVNASTKKARAGETFSINNKIVQGHKGRISKRNKDGSMRVIVVTHAKRSLGKKNIPLAENPQRNDKRNAYVLKSAKNATERQLGKKHDDFIIKNPADKSIVRHIEKQARRNKKKMGWLPLKCRTFIPIFIIIIHNKNKKCNSFLKKGEIWIN